MSSYDYMKENNNLPEYPLSFERRQEIYGYSGQMFLTRNIIFSEYNSNTNSSISANNDAIIDTDVDDLHNVSALAEVQNEQVSEKKEKGTANNQDNLETFVCASDEESCSVSI